MPDGSVLVVEMTGGVLSRVSPRGALSMIAECGGGPNGAAIGPDGPVYVCNNGGGMQDSSESGSGVSSPGPSIQRVDLESGKVEVLYTSCDGCPFRRSNDLVFDTAGKFYFTDFGEPATPPQEAMSVGGLFYGKADGSGMRKVSGPMVTPNGVGLSPNGDRLYMAETLTGRVWYWDIEAPGVVSVTQANYFSPPRARPLCGLGGLKLLDSLAVDSAGNVCVGTLETSDIAIIFPVR